MIFDFEVREPTIWTRVAKLSLKEAWLAFKKFLKVSVFFWALIGVVEILAFLLGWNGQTALDAFFYAVPWYLYATVAFAFVLWRVRGTVIEIPMMDWRLWLVFVSTSFFLFLSFKLPSGLLPVGVFYLFFVSPLLLLYEMWSVYHGSREHLIALADDEPAFIDLLSAELLSEGFHVASFIDKRKLFHALPFLKPDAVFTDLGSPDMDGFEFLTAAKGDYLTRHIPIVVLSAAIDSKSVNEAKRLGAADFIAKPYDFEDVLSSLNRILKKQTSA